MSTKSKYFWPASQITPEDMAMLHAARQAAGVPITWLVAAAIRQTYGRAVLRTAVNQTLQDNNERKT